MAVDQNYTSPWARWALLMHDHPDATHDFDGLKGTDLGIPAAFGGDEHYCVCTIHLNDGTGRTFQAWRELTDQHGKKIDKGTPEEWVKIQAKALGRACKKAGYPDNTLDLKAMLAWRNRNAEIAAISNQPVSTLATVPITELETAPSEPDDTLPDGPDTDEILDVDPDTGEVLRTQQNATGDDS